MRRLKLVESASRRKTHGAIESPRANNDGNNATHESIYYGQQKQGRDKAPFGRTVVSRPTLFIPSPQGNKLVTYVCICLLCAIGQLGERG